MKRSAIGLAMSLSLALSACATFGGNTPHFASDGQSGIDMDKVVAVNQWAQDKGARVMWVNLPQKSKSETASSAN